MSLNSMAIKTPHPLAQIELTASEKKLLMYLYRKMGKAPVFSVSKLYNTVHSPFPKLTQWILESKLIKFARLGIMDSVDRLHPSLKVHKNAKTYIFTPIGVELCKNISSIYKLFDGALYQPSIIKCLEVSVYHHRKANSGFSKGEIINSMIDEHYTRGTAVKALENSITMGLIEPSAFMIIEHGIVLYRTSPSGTKVMKLVKEEIDIMERLTEMHNKRYS